MHPLHCLSFSPTLSHCFPFSLLLNLARFLSLSRSFPPSPTASHPFSPPLMHLQGSEEEGKFQAISKFLNDTEQYLEKLASRLKQLKVCSVTSVSA